MCSNRTKTTLLSMASIAAGKPEADCLSEIEFPKWDQNSQIHDWREYICDDLRLMWSGLSSDAKLIAYTTAANLARSEAWD